MSRGYFGIGIIGGKVPANVGTLWRSAQCMGASYVFTIGHRYKRQHTDTMDATRHVPIFSCDTFEDFVVPDGAEVVVVEQHESAADLPAFKHPRRAVYILGAEDAGVPEHIILGAHSVVSIPTARCINVAVAGSIVMYDRISKDGG